MWTSQCIITITKANGADKKQSTWINQSVNWTTVTTSTATTTANCTDKAYRL
jgi:hypothetical protein